MIVAGFGFRSAASRTSLESAYALACADVTPNALATVSDKAESDVFRAFAQHVNLPITSVSSQTLAAQTTLTTSKASQTARNTGSVAEAAALAGAGPGAQLLTPRQISTDAMATCALAIRETS